jgi:hypothetical protein
MAECVAIWVPGQHGFSNSQHPGPMCEGMGGGFSPVSSGCIVPIRGGAIAIWGPHAIAVATLAIAVEMGGVGAWKACARADHGVGPRLSGKQGDGRGEAPCRAAVWCRAASWAAA